METFIARQPIFDRGHRLYAYELLFRSGPDNLCTSADADQASARVVADSLLLWDRNDLLGGKRAFLNLTGPLLVQDYAALCPAGQTVVEILESVEPDPAVMTACGKLKQAGYRLALDDFTDHDRRTPLVALADFLKVDFLGTEMAERRALVRRYAPAGIHLLAEKVETPEALREASDLGYTYFQGYFFARPTVLRAKGVPEFKLTYLRLLQEILRPELSLGQLETIIRRDVTLSYKLLRYINCAFFGLRRRISSLMEALALLGEGEVRRWGALVALASMGQDKPEELVVQAALRGRFCELLAPAARSARRAEDLFLIGLLSVLDALLDRPLEALLEELPVVDDVKAALLGTQGGLRAIYECALAYVHGDWAKLSEHAERLGIDEAETSRCYRDALAWTRRFLSAGAVVGPTGPDRLPVKPSRGAPGKSCASVL